MILMKENIRKYFLLILVFSSTLFFHFSSPVVTITDSRWVLPLSISISRDHKTNLDAYEIAKSETNKKIKVLNLFLNLFY